jgi:5-methylthioribose kinase
MYRPLSESSAGPFALTMPGVAAHLGMSAADVPACKDLADGNVNLVFRVWNPRDTARSLIVKQALPHARRYPEVKMPLDRARIERDALDVYAQVAPGIAPRVVAFDPEQFVTIMEDLSTHRIMRESVVAQRRHESFAPTLGRFLARTAFFTSDLALDSGEKKRRVTQMTNPVLCKVTEDLVFTFPFIEHATNRFPEALRQDVRALHADVPALRAVARARLAFMTRAEVLSHGDLHTGSIMVNDHETRVIDPEFAFYAPAGFDAGMLVANLAIAWSAQAYHAKDAASRDAYRAWLSDVSVRTIAIFRAEFAACWREHGAPQWQVDGSCDEFLDQTERDALLFCACEMIRRTVGMAHVSELDTIDNADALASVSRSIVASARRTLHGEFSSFNELAASWNT